MHLSEQSNRHFTATVLQYCQYQIDSLVFCIRWYLVLLYWCNCTICHYKCPCQLLLILLLPIVLSAGTDILGHCQTASVPTAVPSEQGIGDSENWENSYQSYCYVNVRECAASAWTVVVFRRLAGTFFIRCFGSSLEIQSLRWWMNISRVALRTLAPMGWCRFYLFGVCIFWINCEV